MEWRLYAVDFLKHCRSNDLSRYTGTDNLDRLCSSFECRIEQRIEHWLGPSA
ncbi:MAG: hypothetical protein QE272_02065 [Nevskia sp.]|nr:hypothetical protein [Nevskia sp.]